MNPPQKVKNAIPKKVKYYVFHSYGKKKIKEAPQDFFKIFVETGVKYIYFEELQMHKLE